MAFLIKDTQLKVKPVAMTQQNEKYIPFPTQEEVAFDSDALLPIGLLSYDQFDERDNEQILIAVPNVQGTFDGDYEYLTYSKTAQGWRLDEEYADALEYKLEEYMTEHYQKAVSFFNENRHLTYGLEEGEATALFELGGQPPLGQNWDAVLYDEMGDNPELDHYHEVMDEESGENFDHMSTREITYLNEESDKEFIFLGAFSYDTYLEGGGECIVFYQPELKKVMVVAEFS
ncbi:hypothetical protein [Thaumasiovibrio subtropicus]|uniref:hypothetical protein n=1 Tax=Thaumasiovibrio subtropicus TaxID=1891207 RepID=UPI000B34C4E8|nr:hypothetical protein [Thaumasiovibrio subtropicus]